MYAVQKQDKKILKIKCLQAMCDQNCKKDESICAEQAAYLRSMNIFLWHSCILACRARRRITNKHAHTRAAHTD